MNRLKIGIEMNGPLGGLLANLDASNVAFDDCTQGINLRKSVADRVENCTFDNIPGTSTFNGLKPYGIFAQSNEATLIKGNSFTGADPANPSWGLVVHNSSFNGTDILENDFDATLTGNQFEGDNSELTARCNDYQTLIGDRAWNVLKSGSIGLLKDQGSPIQNDPKADNQFFATCDNDNERHINADFAFNYYDKTGNPYPADPGCVSDIVNLSIAPDPSNLNCIPEDPPCEPPACFNEWNNSLKTLHDRNRALWGLLHPGVDANDDLKPANYTDAMAILADRNQPEDQMLRIGTLAGQGNYAQAQTELNLLAGTTTEILAYKGYMNAVLASGSDLMNIPDVDYTTAKGYVDDVNTSALAMSQGLHYLREGVYYPLVPLDAGVGSRSGSGKAISGPADTGQDIVVSPNPFVATVSFDFRNLPDSDTYSIEATDLSGNIVWRKRMTGNGQTVWDATSLSSGIYFYRIRSGLGEEVASGKVVKINK